MMRALAGIIVAGPLQAVLVVALFTVLSFLAPPLTSILSYAGAAALALYSLHVGARSGAIVLLGAMLVTGLLTEMLLHHGMTIAVTSLLLWFPVWLIAVVLRETRSLAMAMLALSALAMAGILLVFLWFGDPSQWWLERLSGLINSLADQPEIEIDTGSLHEFAEQVAPFMTGSLAAGLSFAALTCLMLGRWWQSQMVKPGALRKEFYALRLNSMLSLLAVVHATLANLKAARIWLIIIYILMSLLPQAMMLVIVTGLLDPWLDLRRRTEKTETN